MTFAESLEQSFRVTILNLERLRYSCMTELKCVNYLEGNIDEQIDNQLEFALENHEFIEHSIICTKQLKWGFSWKIIPTQNDGILLVMQSGRNVKEFN